MSNLAVKVQATSARRGSDSNAPTADGSAES